MQYFDYFRGMQPLQMGQAGPGVGVNQAPGMQAPQSLAAMQPSYNQGILASIEQALQQQPQAGGLLNGGFQQIPQPAAVQGPQVTRNAAFDERALHGNFLPTDMISYGGSPMRYSDVYGGGDRR